MALLKSIDLCHVRTPDQRWWLLPVRSCSELLPPSQVECHAYRKPKAGCRRKDTIQMDWRGCEAFSCWVKVQFSPGDPTAMSALVLSLPEGTGRLLEHKWLAQGCPADLGQALGQGLCNCNKLCWISDKHIKGGRLKSEEKIPKYSTYRTALVWGRLVFKPHPNWDEKHTLKLALLSKWMMGIIYCSNAHGKGLLYWVHCLPPSAFHWQEPRSTEQSWDSSDLAATNRQLQQSPCSSTNAC